MNKDKKKMIEDMADTMDKLCCERFALSEERCYSGMMTCGQCQAKDLYEAGWRKVAEDEIVVKEGEYAELCMAEYEAIDEAIEYEKQLINLKKDNQEMLKDFAKIVISAIWAEEENEKIKIKDVHDTIRDILRMNFGIELE